MIADPIGLLHEVADAVAVAMRTVTDFGPSGARVGQYALDVIADDAALAVLRRAGVGVLSEESGFNPTSSRDVVVIDPIDGSTNASRGLPWFATSLCLVDDDGPAIALVVNQAPACAIQRNVGEGRGPANGSCSRPPVRRWPTRSSPSLRSRRPMSVGRSSGRWVPARSTCARWPTESSTATSTSGRSRTVCGTTSVDC